MGVKAFYFCKALEGDLVIPEGVTTLSAGIFYNAFALTSITIPDTVTSMDANGDQFANCTAVTSVKLSRNLTELPKTAFFTCKSLKPLPDLSNVTSVGTSCFAGCAALEEMVIPESLTFIGTNAPLPAAASPRSPCWAIPGPGFRVLQQPEPDHLRGPKADHHRQADVPGLHRAGELHRSRQRHPHRREGLPGLHQPQDLTFPASYKAETLCPSV